MRKSISKKIALFAAFGIFILSFTSCQREGCPGMITKHTAQPAQESACN